MAGQLKSPAELYLDDTRNEGSPAAVVEKSHTAFKLLQEKAVSRGQVINWVNARVRKTQDDLHNALQSRDARAIIRAQQSASMWNLLAKQTTAKMMDPTLGIPQQAAAAPTATPPAADQQQAAQALAQTKLPVQPQATVPPQQPAAQSATKVPQTIPMQQPKPAPVQQQTQAAAPVQPAAPKPVMPKQPAAPVQAPATKAPAQPPATAQSDNSSSDEEDPANPKQPAQPKI